MVQETWVGMAIYVIRRHGLVWQSKLFNESLDTLKMCEKIGG